MKTIILLHAAIILAVPLIGNCDRIETSPGVQVITQDMIRQSGMMRLSDIFPLIEDWDISTIDGITWMAGPDGLSSYQHPEWAIMLDGNLIDIDLLGVRALDRLPINLEQISLIRVISRPGLYNGYAADAGLIDIRTTKTDSGSSLYARAGIGNEIGDPGPYRYTEYASPNIDKVGHAASASLSCANTNSYFRLAYKQTAGYPTDNAVFQRNQNIAGNRYPRIELQAMNASYGQSNQLSGYSMYAGGSWSDDFFFLKQYGREIPAKSSLKYFSLNGHPGVQGWPDFRYRISYSSNLLDKEANAAGIDFDWKKEHVYANIETPFGWTDFGGHFGLGINHHAVHTGTPLDEDALTFGILYGHIDIDISQNNLFSFDLSLNNREGKAGFFGAMKMDQYAWKNSLIRVSISYSLTQPEELNNIWYWTLTSYDFFDMNGIEYEIDGELQPQKKFAADLDITQNLSKKISLTLSGNYRSFSQYACENQQFEFNPADYSFSGPVMVTTNNRAKTAGGKISVNFYNVSGIRMELSYRYRTILEGSNAFRADLRVIPEHHLRGTINYRPVQNFNLWALIQYTGASYWVDYDAISDQSGGLYSAAVKKNISLDISAQKYFSERKISAIFTIRNLFNNDIRYHPIGAQFDLSYFAQLELMID